LSAGSRRLRAARTRSCSTPAPASRTGASSPRAGACCRCPGWAPTSPPRAGRPTPRPTASPSRASTGAATSPRGSDETLGTVQTSHWVDPMWEESSVTWISRTIARIAAVAVVGLLLGAFAAPAAAQEPPPSTPPPPDAPPPASPWPLELRSRSSTNVRPLQLLLVGVGQDVAVDGVFGPETEAAVREV